MQRLECSNGALGSLRRREAASVRISSDHLSIGLVIQRIERDDSLQPHTRKADGAIRRAGQIIGDDQNPHRNASCF
ncbi:hypothetical protein D3C84_570680 [compost metagenome]